MELSYSGNGHYIQAIRLLMNFIFEVNIIKLLAALDLSRIIPTTGADAARNEDMGLVNVSFIRRLINPKM